MSDAKENEMEDVIENSKPVEPDPHFPDAAQ